MKVDQMAAIAIESITSTAAYRWWGVIKNSGRVHASDIYDEDCPLHSGGLKRGTRLNLLEGVRWNVR